MKKFIFAVLCSLYSVALAGLGTAPSSGGGGPGSDTTALHSGTTENVNGTLTNLSLRAVTIKTSNGNNFLTLTGTGTILFRQNDGDVFGSFNSLSNEGPYGSADRLPVTTTNYVSGTWSWDNSVPNSTLVSRTGVTTPILSVGTSLTLPSASLPVGVLTTTGGSDQWVLTVDAGVAAWKANTAGSGTNVGISTVLGNSPAGDAQGKHMTNLTMLGTTNVSLNPNLFTNLTLSTQGFTARTRIGATVRDAMIIGSTAPFGTTASGVVVTNSFFWATEGTVVDTGLAGSKGPAALVVRGGTGIPVQIESSSSTNAALHKFVWDFGTGQPAGHKLVIGSTYTNQTTHRQIVKIGYILQPTNSTARIEACNWTPNPTAGTDTSYAEDTLGSVGTGTTNTHAGILTLYVNPGQRYRTKDKSGNSGEATTRDTGTETIAF